MPEMVKKESLLRSILTFRVRGRQYGLDVACVREVSTHRDFTPVLQAPPLVHGLANLRSRIFLVLDSGIALGNTPVQTTAESRLIVLHDRVADCLGLLVERGGDIVQVPNDQIEDIALADGMGAPRQADSSPVISLCKLENELMMIVDPCRIVIALETAIRRHAVE